MTQRTRPVKKPSGNRRQHGQRGFTLFELIVVVSIISILSGVALTKYFGLLVDVERTSMEQNLGAMRSAVALQMLDHIAKDDMAGVVAMADTNPMSYMVQTPGNYLGALDNPVPAKIAGGDWYYDKKEKVLVYRVEHSSYFRTSLAGPSRAEFNIALAYQDVNHDGRFEPGTDSFEGLLVKPLKPYRWLKEPI